MRAAIENNVVATTSMSAVCFQGHPDGQSLELARNVLLGAKAVQIYEVISGIEPGRPREPVLVHARGNILAGRDGVLDYLVSTDTGQGAPPPERALTGTELENRLRRIVVWREEHNVSAEGVPLLTLNEARAGRVEPTRRYQTVEEWNQLWGLAESTSLRGPIRFEGGDLHAKLEMMGQPLTLGDFQLQSNSTGYRAAADGLDLGPDLDLVGPGPAYERWQKTPEYQEWLKK